MLSKNIEPHYQRVLKPKIKPHVDFFEDKAGRYDQWFDRHHHAFMSELNAISTFIPDDGLGVEIGLGSGRFSAELGIKDGVEPSKALSAIATERGIEVINAKAENLPYKDLRFDFALMVSISYLDNLKSAFKEARRVLKRKGNLVVGMIDKDSLIGQYYQSRKKENGFYSNARFYTVDKVTELLKASGFKNIQYSQTLFGFLDDMTSNDDVKDGYGEGSFVVISCTKK